MTGQHAIPFRHQKGQCTDHQQDGCSQQDQARIEVQYPGSVTGPPGRTARQQPETVPQIFIAIVEDGKPDPPHDDQKCDRQVKGIIEAQGGVKQPGRKRGKSGITEGGNRMKQGRVAPVSPIGKELGGEGKPYGDKPGYLQEDRDQYYAIEGMKNLAESLFLVDAGQEDLAVIGKLSGEEIGKHGGKGHDPQTPDLDEEKDHRLSKPGKPELGIQHAQTGDTHGTGGREQGVNGGDPRRGGRWQQEE